MNKAAKKILFATAFLGAVHANTAEATSAAGAGALMLQFGNTANNSETVVTLVEEKGIPKSLVEENLRNDESTANFIAANLNNPDISAEELKQNGLRFSGSRDECISETLEETANCMTDNAKKKNLLLALGLIGIVGAIGGTAIARDMRSTKNNTLKPNV